MRFAHAITVFTSEHSRNLPTSEASSFIFEEMRLEILEKGVTQKCGHLSPGNRNRRLLGRVAHLLAEHLVADDQVRSVLRSIEQLQSYPIFDKGISLPFDEAHRFLSA